MSLFTIKINITHYIAGIVLLLISPFNFAETEKLTEVEAFALYDQLNSTDIALGKLAIKRGKHDAVTSLGKMITTDHKQIRNQARLIATKQGIWHHKNSYAKVLHNYEAKIAELKTIAADKFDNRYMKYEVTFSDYAIEAVEHQILPAITNQQLHDFIKQNFARMKNHMAHIEMAKDSLENGTAMPAHHHGHHHH